MGRLAIDKKDETLQCVDCVLRRTRLAETSPGVTKDWDIMMGKARVM